MTSKDLEGGLEGLSTERLLRLVDCLEKDPDVELTIGAWRPLCPMVLAGFNPDGASSNTAENRFASAWDRFAKPQWRWRTLVAPARRIARRSDVQVLTRTANGVLARRASRDATRAASALSQRHGVANYNDTWRP